MSQYINHFNSVADKLKVTIAATKDKASLANELAWSAARVYILGTFEDMTTLKESIAKDAKYNFAKSYVSRAKKVVLYFNNNKESIVTTKAGLNIDYNAFKTMAEAQAFPDVALHGIAQAIDALATESETYTDVELQTIGKKLLKLTDEDINLGGVTAINQCLEAGKKFVADKQAKAQAKQQAQGIEHLFNSFMELSFNDKCELYNRMADFINQDTLQAVA